MVFKKGDTPWIKGKQHSIESREKISINNIGRIPWNKGKEGMYSKETLMKMAENGKWNKGRRFTALHKKRISVSHIGIMSTPESREKMCRNHANFKGENHPQWKGGKVANWRRQYHKRKRQYGFTELNTKECVSWHAHHLDREHILYIPNNIHKNIRHKQTDSDSMNRINKQAIDWYVYYYGLL